MLAYIWAEDRAGHIGNEGKLPWNLPADLAYFKKQTMGHPMLMGRKTFDSFPGLLPHRLHLVLTSSAALKKQAETTEKLAVFNSVEEMLTWLTKHQAEEVFVIGGASLFELLKDQVDVLYQTKIDAVFAGDVTSPEIDYQKFDLISVTPGQVDERNKYPYEFRVYKRKEN